MVLEREQERIGRGLESALVYGVYDVDEEDLAAQAAAVRDHRFAEAVVLVAVELNASAAGEQHLPVHLAVALARDLMSGEIRVVTRVDKVVRKRLAHVVAKLVAARLDQLVLRIHQIAEQTARRKLIFIVGICFLFVVVVSVVGWAELSLLLCRNDSSDSYLLIMAAAFSAV